jgi:NhaP-type Na+/H+ or K+/H+ antiporter
MSSQLAINEKILAIAIALAAALSAVDPILRRAISARWVLHLVRRPMETEALR